VLVGEPLLRAIEITKKVVVGREILHQPGVLVVSRPTWGVDAGAAASIRQALIDLTARGAELTEIADRIAVMFRGRLLALLTRGEASREKLGLLMGGSPASGHEVDHAARA
jgi:simple sugar transport system ATP-binding protein